MRKFFVAFGGFVGLVSALVTIYIGADQFHVLWAFWLVLVVGVPGAAWFTWGKKAVEAIVKMRNYDHILERMVAAEDGATEHLRALQQRWEAGVLFGRSDVLGAITAVTFDGVLTPTEALTADDEVVVAASISGDSRPEVRARFTLKLNSLGVEKGVMEVVGFSPDGASALLKCSAPTDEPFWDSLRLAAQGTPMALSGLSLTPLSLRDLMEKHRSPTEAIADGEDAP